MEHIVTEPLIPEVVAPSESSIIVDNPISKVQQKMKDALLLFESNGFDLDDALIRAGYSQVNMKMVRKRFLGNDYVKRHIQVLFEKDRKFAKSKIVTLLNQTLDSHAEKAQHDVYHAGILIKLTERISTLLGLEDDVDHEEVTLDKLIRDAKRQ